MREKNERKTFFLKKREGGVGSGGSIGFFFFLKVAGFYLVWLRGEKESRNKEVFINNNNKFLCIKKGIFFFFKINKLMGIRVMMI